jgi:hypothetical protein
MEEDVDADKPPTDGLGLVVPEIGKSYETKPSKALSNGDNTVAKSERDMELENRESKEVPTPDAVNDNTSLAAAGPSSSPTRSSFRQHLAPFSSNTQGFKVPQLPTKPGPSKPDNPLLLPPKTPQPVCESHNLHKLRRWSSTSNANLHRRNSFPYSRKDTLEDIRALRLEAKKQLLANGPPSFRIRKRSDSNTVTASGVEGNGYFTLKPNVPSDGLRTRSTTTHGILPPSTSTRKEFFHVSSTPLITPRLEALRRDTGRSNAEKLPTTLLDYLMLELEDFDVKGVEEHKKERLRNFLRIPQTLEKVVTFRTVLM